MRSFIYDQYGYLLEKDVNEFSFEGYDFRLVAHEKSEDEVRELTFALNELKKTLPFSVKSFIVESRNHTLVTENEFGNVSLIAAKPASFLPSLYFQWHTVCQECDLR